MVNISQLVRQSKCWDWKEIPLLWKNLCHWPKKSYSFERKRLTRSFKSFSPSFGLLSFVNFFVNCIPYYSAAEVVEWFVDVHHLWAWLEYSSQEGGAAPPVGVDDDLALPWEIASIVPFSLELQRRLELPVLFSFMSWTGRGWDSISEINYCGHTAVYNEDFEQLFHDSNRNLLISINILIHSSYWPPSPTTYFYYY